MPKDIGDTSVDTSAQAKIAKMLSDDLMIAEDTLVPEDEPSPAKESQPAPGAKKEEAEDDEPDARPEDQEDEDEPEEKPVPPAKRKLKVGEDELDEEEVVKGYLRQSDYTRKTQELAEKRKKLELEELPKVQAQEAEYASRLKELEDAIKAQTPQEPDWDKLRAEKPEAFERTFAEWQIYKQRMDKLADARREADAKVAENERKASEQRSEAAAQRLLELLPEWKDETTMRKDAQAIAKLVEPLGITKAELAGLQRPELFVLLRKAAQFDALTAEVEAGRVAAQKKAPVREADLGAEGRPEERDSAGREFERDFKVAAKKGTPEAAARAIRHMLD